MSEKKFEDFASYLKQQMARRGHTISSIAKLLKNEDGGQLSVETVRRWTKAGGLPRRNVIEQIAAVLSVDEKPFFVLASGGTLADVEQMSEVEPGAGEITREVREWTPRIVEGGLEEPESDIELQLKSALSRINALEDRLQIVEQRLSRKESV